MLSESRALKLTAAADKVTTLAAELTAATEARNKTIRDLLLLGATPAELSQVTGISRMRIYQIRDGRR